MHIRQLGILLVALATLVLALPTLRETLRAQSGTATAEAPTAAVTSEVTAAIHSEAISCADKPAFPSGATQQTINSGGLMRSYVLYVPSSYKPTQPTPLVFSLHGYGSIGSEQETYSRWDKLAQSQTFIAVYPNGTGSPLRWNAGQRGIPGLNLQGRGVLTQFFGGFFETDSADDVTFMSDLVTLMSSQFCIDPARIYVNGISNGGGMTNRLACQLSTVFAAAAMVDGAYTNFPGGCQPSRPVPILAFHGKADRIVPYNGVASIGFPAIQTWVADWASRDQCASTPYAIPGTVGSVTGIRYINCADNAEVDFYTIADGGHTWPGAASVFPNLLGKTTQDIDATATMWAFFKAHPMG